MMGLPSPSSLSRVAMLHVCVLLAAAYLAEAAPLTDWIDGQANHYGGPQELSMIDPFNPRVLLGGCNYGDLDPTKYPFYNVASFHPDSVLTTGMDQFGCGACFEVRCNDIPESCLSGGLGTEDGTSIVVVSSGTCGAGCGPTQANLHVFAFDKLAPIRLGMVDIQIRQVTCEPLGNVMVLIRNYRAEKSGYIKLVVRNVPASGTLSSVQLRATGGTSWLTLQNLFGASWEGSLLPDPPFDLRLIETSGSEVILEGAIQDPGFTGEIDTGKQFPGFSSFPESARENFVDSEMAAPPSGDAPSDPPDPFRVGVSPSPSAPGRPEVGLEDLDPEAVIAGGK